MGPLGQLSGRPAGRRPRPVREKSVGSGGGRGDHWGSRRFLSRRVCRTHGAHSRLRPHPAPHIGSGLAKPAPGPQDWLLRAISRIARDTGRPAPTTPSKKHRGEASRRVCGGGCTTEQEACGLDLSSDSQGHPAHGLAQTCPLAFFPCLRQDRLCCNFKPRNHILHTEVNDHKLHVPLG